MYETQLYLSYTQQRVLHVLEHCKFLFSELEKKIANEQQERKPVYAHGASTLFNN